MTDKEKQTSQLHKILKAATTCISERGYANITMRDIAKEAGVALGQINYHYKNKESLIIAVINNIKLEYFTRAKDYLSKVKTPDQCLLLITEYFKDTAKNNPERIRLLYDIINIALWEKSISIILVNLFDELAQLAEKYIFIDNLKDGVLNNYSLKTKSQC